MAMFGEAGATISKPVSNQDKIRYLKRHVILDREINRLLVDLDRQRARLGKVTPTFNNMPTGGGSIYKNHDIDTVDKIVDLEIKINQRVDEAIQIRDEVEQLINNVDDDNERLLLNHRYIDGQTFEWIAGEMNYSWRHTHRLHSKALASLKL